MKKVIYAFLSTVGILVLVAEVGQKYTHFGKDGDFIMVFFYSTLIAAIFTLIVANTHHDNRD